jgi:LmbE family N-acetylglucosaminyl deacetylase
VHVLAVGAHPDDIELGCAGTLARHVAVGDVVTLLVMSDGSSGPGPIARRVREQELAAEVLGAELLWGDFPDGTISNHEQSALHLIEEVLGKTGARRMYTHGAGDSHQDHRTVAQLSFGAARNLEEVLAYDSPSSRFFDPHLYVDISSTVQVKLDALGCHDSQVRSSQRVRMDFVTAQAQYRGGLVRVGAAEAFMVERLLLRIGE